MHMLNKIPKFKAIKSNIKSEIQELKAHMTIQLKTDQSERKMFLQTGFWTPIGELPVDLAFQKRIEGI